MQDHIQCRTSLITIGVRYHQTNVWSVTSVYHRIIISDYKIEAQLLMAGQVEFVRI
jgi:hypothetical protein